MASAHFIGSAAVGLPGEVHTEAKNPVGMEVSGFDASGYWAVWKYLPGCASVVEGSWVSYDEVGATALLDSDTAQSIVSQVAVATAAVDATTEYGWFQIVGRANALCLSATADNGKLFATATGGSAEDAAVTGNQIHSAFARAASPSATGGGLTICQIDRPYVGVTDAII